MKVNIKLSLRTATTMLFTLAFFLTIINSVTHAQDRRDSSTSVTNDVDFESRQKALRLISEKKPNARTKEVLAQIQEDFMAMQVANKSLKDATTAREVIDLKFVTNSVGEIKKRAERLNTNLALAGSAKDADRPKVIAAASKDELKTSLTNLSKLIRDFVTNPCFKQPSSASDSKLVAKAEIDLEGIIALSKQLQKDTEKLGKASQTNAP